MATKQQANTTEQTYPRRRTLGSNRRSSHKKIKVIKKVKQKETTTKRKRRGREWSKREHRQEQCKFKMLLIIERLLQTGLMQSMKSNSAR